MQLELKYKQQINNFFKKKKPTIKDEFFIVFKQHILNFNEITQRWNFSPPFTTHTCIIWLSQLIGPNFLFQA